MTDEQLKAYGFFDKAHWTKAVQDKFPGKRFTTGKRILGPEFPGCFNTGTRPTLRRAADGKFMVGRELDVMEITDRRLFGGKKSQRTWKMDHGRKVTVLASRKAAIAMFADMCESDSRSHAKERAEVAQATKDAKSKDPSVAMGAILRLGDSGMI